MTCLRGGGLLKSYPNFFINLYVFVSNTSLVHTLSRSIYSWSKPLEEVMKPARGALINVL